MARRRQRRAVASFASMHDAMACERVCEERGVEGRLIPTPVAIAADCGLAWAMSPDVREAFEEAARGAFAYEAVTELEL